MKTSELQGTALDYAVAKANGADPLFLEDFACNGEHRSFSPSTDWAQGGPIIERERIELLPNDDTAEWFAECHSTGVPFRHFGPTPLIAAMRCYVASKWGDTVDTPPELLP